MNIWIVVWAVYVSMSSIGRPNKAEQKWEVFESSTVAYSFAEKNEYSFCIVGPIDTSRFCSPRKSFSEIAKEAADETDRQLYLKNASPSFLEFLISEYEKLSDNPMLDDETRHILNTKIRGLRLAIQNSKWSPQR